MAKKDDTSKARRGRNSAATKFRSAASPTKSAKATPSPERLEDIVEDERARLMKAHSILDCVITAMEDEESYTGDGPYWPSVIESARDLINESIRRLEDLDYDPKAKRAKKEVREPALPYGFGAWTDSESLSTSDSDEQSEEGASSCAARRKAERADVAAALAPLSRDRRLN